MDKKKTWKKSCKNWKKAQRQKIIHDSLRATLINIPNWKTPGHDGLHGIWF